MKKERLLFLFTVIIGAANLFFLPERTAVHIFAIIYLVIIYFGFKPDFREFLYYITIFLALMGSTYRLQFIDSMGVNYYYITMLVYLFLMVLNRKELHMSFGEDPKGSVPVRYALFGAVYLLYAAGGVIFARNLGLALGALKMYVVFAGLLIVIVDFNKNFLGIRKTFRLLSLVYPGFLLLGTLQISGINLGLENALESRILSGVEYYRRIPVLFYANQNNYAFILVLGMVMIFGVYPFLKSRTSKYFYIFIYALSEVNLIFTTARIAWVSIILTFVLTIILSILIKNKELKTNTLRFVLITLSVVFIASFIPTVQPYFGKMVYTPVLKYLFMGVFLFGGSSLMEFTKGMISGSQFSIRVRIRLVRNIIRGIVVEKHYFGFGTGNTRNYLAGFKNTGGIVNPHSLWFEIMGDFGIPIFIYSVVMYLWLLWDLLGIFKSRHDEFGKYGLMMFFTAFNIIFISFAPSSVIGFSPFWIALGLELSVITALK